MSASRNKSSTLLTFSLVFMVASTPFAAPADPTTAEITTPPAGTPATAPAPVVGNRDPLIEVSVDSLEISETNDNNFGFLYGQQGSQNAFENGKINFFEASAEGLPSLLKVGDLRRNALFNLFEALVRNQQARVLANPTLITKSGFEASFLVGGEIPYPQVGQGGVTGVEFKKYGVALKILPQLTPRRTIEAQINVGVSNIDNSVSISLQNGISVPGLRSNEAGTKVEVNDGETVVLAGIKQSRREKTLTKVPILGSIPLIGILFRHKGEKVVQNSLVEFVTFRLVK